MEGNGRSSDYQFLEDLSKLDQILKDLRNKRALAKDDNAQIKFPNVNKLFVDSLQIKSIGKFYDNFVDPNVTPKTLQIRFGEEQFYKKYCLYGDSSSENDDSSDEYGEENDQSSFPLELITSLKKNKKTREQKETERMMEKIAFYSQAFYGLAKEVELCTGKRYSRHFEYFKDYNKDKTNNIFKMTSYKDEVKVEGTNRYYQDPFTKKVHNIGKKMTKTL